MEASSSVFRVKVDLSEFRFGRHKILWFLIHSRQYSNVEHLKRVLLEWFEIDAAPNDVEVWMQNCCVPDKESALLLKTDDVVVLRHRLADEEDIIIENHGRNVVQQTSLCKPKSKKSSDDYGGGGDGTDANKVVSRSVAIAHEPLATHRKKHKKSRRHSKQLEDDCDEADVERASQLENEQSTASGVTLGWETALDEQSVRNGGGSELQKGSGDRVRKKRAKSMNYSEEQPPEPEEARLHDSDVHQRQKKKKRRKDKERGQESWPGDETFETEARSAMSRNRCSLSAAGDSNGDTFTYVETSLEMYGSRTHDTNPWKLKSASPWTELAREMQQHKQVSDSDAGANLAQNGDLRSSTTSVEVSGEPLQARGSARSASSFLRRQRRRKLKAALKASTENCHSTETDQDGGHVVGSVVPGAHFNPLKSSTPRDFRPPLSNWKALAKCSRSTSPTRRQHIKFTADGEANGVLPISADILPSSTEQPDGSGDAGARAERVLNQTFGCYLDEPEARESLESVSFASQAASQRIRLAAENEVLTNKSIIIPNPIRLGIKGEETVPQEDYSQYPVLTGPPRVNDVIAYKILELSETYTPEVSSFRVGKVLKFDQVHCEVLLEYPEPVVVNQRSGKFELSTEDEISESTFVEEVAMDLSSMVEVRLIVDYQWPTAK